MVDSKERERKIKDIKNFLFICSLNPKITLRTKAKMIAIKRISEVENILFVCSLDPETTLETTAKLIIKRIYDKKFYSGNHDTKIVL